MALGTIAAHVGKGLFAGAAGTALMTVSSTIEARMRNRGASSAPADAASEVLGVEPHDEGAKQRFGDLVHWGYGTGWGAARGIVEAAGLHGVPATGAHLAMVWGAEQVALPATGVAPPIGQWGAKEIAVDLLHHAVYVTGTALAYAWLNRD